ncbi:HNH endonuclease [Megasphaera massiliensis]|uniref:HNH endonuclease n=1 Tax=Megasphaera massiliensis TaxID=1232428 RepID=UPI0005CA712D|nr:MAG TPA: HNH endonuclease bacteriophage, HNH Endonuclease, DNA.52A [Caudoviricetes sp.]
MAREFSRDFYNSTRWRKCAKEFAKSKLYICERCHNQYRPKPGKKRRYIVHHKKPLTPDNIDDEYIAYGWDNLELLCLECHNTTHAPSGAGRRMTFDEDGNLIGIDDALPPH